MNNNNLRKVRVLHPILFAIFPITFLFSINLHTLVLEDILIPLSLVVTASILLWILLRYIFKSTEKSGLLVSVYLALFFTYGHIFFFIDGSEIGGFEVGRHRFLLIVYAAVFIIASYYFTKTKRTFLNATTVSNYISATLFVIILVNIGTYYLENNYLYDRDIAAEKYPFDVSGITTYPDIYYIILDDYANSKSLEKYLDYDNQEFIKFLTKQGFDVADESYSNYPSTLLSLPSIMNMKYVNYLSEKYYDSNDEHELYHIMDFNLVTQYYKSIGYETINFDGGNFFNDIENFDQNLCIRNVWHEELWSIIQHTTILGPLSIKKSADDLREYRLCVFSELPTLQHNNDKPIFVFAHIMMPHSPYLFKANGEPQDQDKVFLELDLEFNKLPYLEQLEFVNKKTQEIIDKLLLESDVPPIIIIHSDHGARMGIDDWNTAVNDEKLVERIFNNFDAYYLPGEQKSLPDEPRTPVNTFRIIFNSYFNGEYDLLENRSYYSNPFDKIYQFKDVTNTLIKN